MPLFEIQHPDGRTFQVDAPSIEQATAAMGHAPAPQADPDPVRRQVRGELDADRARGIPGSDAGYADRILHGATFGASDEIIAGVGTPFEMFRRGTWSPSEGYKYAKTRQDLMLEDASKKQGLPGHIAELAGGVGSGVGLARGGVTLARQGAGFLRNSLGMGAEGAAYGGVTGFNDSGNSLDERLGGAVRGATVGAGVGAALPAAGAVLSHTVAPLASAARAMVNPGGVAESQFARGLADSGHSAQDISDAVARAAREGQGEFTAADAMGHSGQRLLSTVAGAPGPGRQAAVDFLDARQAGQGRRVANILAEGMQAPETAVQARTRLTTARDTEADTAYGAVRDDAGPVDVSNVIRHIDQTLRPGVNQIVNPGANLAPDSVEAALAGVRGRLTDGRSQLTDFTSLQRVRGDLADAISRAHRAGEGNKVRLLTQVREQMDHSMEHASEGFRAANADFARRSGTIDAIDTGSTAAMRGRTEDTIPAFRAMQPGQQQAFRTGYVDPLIAQAQGGAVGVNKARPLTSDAYQGELHAIAPLATGNPMMTRLGRENTMFATRGRATGGSRTAENLEDNAAQRIDPGVLLAIATGHPIAAAGNLARNTLTNLSGYTPAVRERLAQLLLMRGNNPQVAQVTGRVEANLARQRAVTAMALRGLLAGNSENVTAANR